MIKSFVLWVQKVGDLTKFNFIEQCDFYILIGRSFQFDEHKSLKSFLTVFWRKKKNVSDFF